MFLIRGQTFGVSKRTFEEDNSNSDYPQLLLRMPSDNRATTFYYPKFLLHALSSPIANMRNFNQ